jgi:hypothetical protein
MQSMQVCALFVAAFIAAPAAERYDNIHVGQDGKVIVVTDDGRHISPPNDGDQVSANQATIAPDHESVGWLALYPFCCTSYPLPLKLMVLSNGQLRALKGESGYPIWHWGFQDGGKRVAFSEETPHGSRGLHYELWDVKSGRRVADYTPEYDENGFVIARPNEPQWVRALDASSKPR